MLEGYSTEIAVETNSAIPFNNITISKGVTAVFAGPATIQFNKCGVYSVHFSGSASPTTEGDVSVQLSKNGVLQPQALSTFTGTVGDSSTLEFNTLVQVKENNTNCCCSSPTIIQCINTGEASNYTIAKIDVTKIC